jgi:hypothetical protein
MTLERVDLMRRFITFIDVMYEHKVKVLAAAAERPAELFDRGGGRVGTFHNVILQSKHQPITVSMVHVTNPTPGIANPRRGRRRVAARRGVCVGPSRQPPVRDVIGRVRGGSLAAQERRLAAGTGQGDGGGVLSTLVTHFMWERLNFLSRISHGYCRPDHVSS